jgi:APA family basic amino acid/polyamine antiporter
VLRSLGLIAAISIGISNMIGQGVFLKARAMTCDVGSPGPMLAAWGVAGLLALCGALTFGELGAAIPESGGIYAFLRRAYGGPIAFAYGWMNVFVASPAGIGALAAGAAIFFNLASGGALDFDLWGTAAKLPFALSGMQCGAVALILVLTAVNLAPAHLNGRIVTASAALKIGMLVVLTLAAFGFRHGDVAHFAASGASGTCSGIAASPRGGVPGFAAALVGALYAYAGWQSLTLVAGEVKTPGRSLPRALIASILIVIVLYVAANAAFVYVLSPHAIASLAPNESVGVSVVEALFGSAWRVVAAAFLFASVAATLHATILTGARITYAMALHTPGMHVLGRVSGRGGVPQRAVLANSLLAIFLVLVGNFDTLSNYVVFNTWVFYVAAGAATFVLRRREPAMPRPYRTLGYPYVPFAYVAVGTWLVVQTALGSPQASAIGLGIVALSFPVYYLQHRRARS